MAGVVVSMATARQTAGAEHARLNNEYTNIQMDSLEAETLRYTYNIPKSASIHQQPTLLRLFKPSSANFELQ